MSDSRIVDWKMSKWLKDNLHFSESGLQMCDLHKNILESFYCKEQIKVDMETPELHQWYKQHFLILKRTLC